MHCTFLWMAALLLTFHNEQIAWFYYFVNIRQDCIFIMLLSSSTDKIDRMMANAFLNLFVPLYNDFWRLTQVQNACILILYTQINKCIFVDYFSCCEKLLIFRLDTIFCKLKFILPVSINFWQFYPSQGLNLRNSTAIYHAILDSDL